MSPAQPVNTSPESLTNVMQNLQPPGSEEHCAGTHLIVSNLLGMGMARFFLPLSEWGFSLFWIHVMASAIFGGISGGCQYRKVIYNQYVIFNYTLPIYSYIYIPGL